MRADGSRFWALAVIDAVRDHDGKLIGFAKVTRDMTERQLEQSRLLESERQFRHLVESVVDYAIFRLDKEGLVATWNRGAERIKGYSADEIIGRHFSVFYTEEDRAAGVPARTLSTARSEGRFESEGWRMRKDGTRFWASVVVDPIRNDNGEIVAIREGHAGHHRANGDAAYPARDSGAARPVPAHGGGGSAQRRHRP